MEDTGLCPMGWNAETVFVNSGRPRDYCVPSLPICTAIYRKLNGFNVVTKRHGKIEKESTLAKDKIVAALSRVRLHSTAPLHLHRSKSIEQKTSPL